MSSFSVIIACCSSFHLWMRSLYSTLTTLRSIDLLLLNPFLNASKFAQRVHVAASTKHCGAFSWPSLWKCSISLFENRESSANSKKKEECNGYKREGTPLPRLLFANNSPISCTYQAFHLIVSVLFPISHVCSHTGMGLTSPLLISVSHWVSAIPAVCCGFPHTFNEEFWDLGQGYEN